MVPLVASVMELHLVRDQAEQILAEVGTHEGVTLDVPIGTMIELPRAALTAHRIAEAADFFSFGTNDLTQTTWGFSRDDVEGAFFDEYLDKGVFTVSPSRPSTSRRGWRWSAWRSRRAGRRVPACRSASAVSTAGTRSRSTSSTTPGSTTSRARRSGCR